MTYMTLEMNCISKKHLFSALHAPKNDSKYFVLGYPHSIYDKICNEMICMLKWKIFCSHILYGIKYYNGNSRTKNDMRYFEFDGNYRIHLICRDSALNWHQLPSEIIWLQGSITTSRLCTRMKVCNLPFSLYSIASFNLIVCSYSKSWKLSVVLAFNVRLINHEWLNNQ